MAAEHVTKYMGRGLIYAVTSTCAIVAGYLMQTPSFQWRDLLVLAIPAITSVFFFICYARRFHSLEYRNRNENDIGAILEMEAIYIFPIIALLLILLIIFTQPLPWKILIAFGIYGAMFVYYGVFLARLSYADDVPVVRHRLVWSVVLSIGVSLYYGLTFSVLKTSLRPLVPIGLLVLVYIASEIFQWRKMRFLRRTLIAAFALTVLTVLLQTGVLPLPYRLEQISNGLGQFFWAILFCLAASAYVSVFEAWKVTSDIARQAPNQSEHDSTPQDSHLNRASQYSIATLAALMVTVSVLPFYFIFSRYGVVFLVGFVIHATASFVFWYLWGRDKYLKSLPWGTIKIVAGVLFLALLVVVTFFNVQATNHSIEWFASSNGLTILTPFVGFLAFRLYLSFRRVFRKSRKSIWLRLLDARVNFVRVLSILCWVACFAIITLIHNRRQDSAEHLKGELAFNAYAVCIALCIVVEILDSIGIIKPMTSIRRSLVGVLLLIRVAPSSLIGLCVLLPAIHKGVRMDVALLSAVPFFLAALGGFALNDYYDANTDRINKPYRAIPSNRISKSVVGVIGAVSLLAATLLAVVASRSRIELCLYLISIAGVVSYNLLVKYLSLSKTFLTSAVSALPLLFSVLTLQYQTVFLFVPIATCLFVLGREWLMDIRDVKGDREAGTTTFPMLLGPELTAKCGFVFQVLSVVLLCPIALVTRSPWSVALIGLICLTIALSARFWYYRAGNHQQGVIRGLWIPMLLGIMMLL